MNKTELIEAVAKDARISKADAGKAVNALTATVTKALKKGDTVTLIGFGIFKVTKRAARNGRNLELVNPSRVLRARRPDSPLARHCEGCSEQIIGHC